MCKVNRFICLKTWFVSFVLMRAHKQILFLGYSMYISGMDFLCSSVNTIVNNKKLLLWEIYPFRYKKLLDKKWWRHRLSITHFPEFSKDSIFSHSTSEFSNVTWRRAGVPDRKFVKNYTFVPDAALTSSLFGTSESWEPAISNDI